MFDIEAVNPQFIDCDLAVEAERLGIPKGDCGLPRFANFGASYEDAVTLIDEDRWKPLADEGQADQSTLAWLIRWILNQRNEGSCVGNAFTQAIQVLLAKVFGKDRAIQMSAISAYKQIGRSPNSGANVGDGLDAVQNIGILPLDTPENRQRFKHVMPATGFYTPWPDGWKETAANFRVTEAHVIQSVKGLVSALLNRHPVVVGRDGHSIVYLDIVFKGNSMYALYANSWGDWGSGAGGLPSGFGLDSLRTIQSSASWCCALRTLTVPSFMLPA